MESGRVILLVLAGAVICLIGVVTFQWLLAFLVLVFVVLVLVCLDTKKWLESLAEKHRCSVEISLPEVTRLEESLAAVKKDLAAVKQRLDALENEGRK